MERNQGTNNYSILPSWQTLRIQLNLVVNTGFKGIFAPVNFRYQSMLVKLAGYIHKVSSCVEERFLQRTLTAGDSLSALSLAPAGSSVSPLTAERSFSGYVLGCMNTLFLKDCLFSVVKSLQCKYWFITIKK